MAASWRHGSSGIKRWRIISGEMKESGESESSSEKRSIGGAEKENGEKSHEKQHQRGVARRERRKRNINGEENKASAAYQHGGISMAARASKIWHRSWHGGMA